VSSVVSRGSTSSMQGRGSGPLRAMCEVLAARRIGEYYSLTFVAPEMAERAEPGQFVSIGVKTAGAILRRPFSIYSVSRHGPWAGTIEIVFDVAGPGTEWLATLAKHDVVDLVAPLGRAFPIPAQDVECLLVGGGYGAAPLLFLAQKLQQENLRVHMVMGAGSQDRLFNVIEAKRLSATAAFTTDDGSFGTPGKVTDVMQRMLTDTPHIGVVYACGPMAMLGAVTAVARRHKVAVQVAVEEAMACGVGVCMTCVLPVKRDGEIVHVRSCVEGPVLNGKRIAWERVGAPSAAAPEPADEPEAELRP
jgi:dihydroorotate dehydrogenase electron transfer subunit